MDGLTITQVTTENGFENLSEFAAGIWREHFTPILPDGQVDYMLDKFQSKQAMMNGVENENYSYYLMEFCDAPAGYIAIKPDGDRLFLSKLYVEKSYRGKGISSAALEFLKKYCRENGFGSIWLTVNRYNYNTIEIYKHFGFKVFKECATDIGGGYVMDDYFMELAL